MSDERHKTQNKIQMIN